MTETEELRDQYTIEVSVVLEYLSTPLGDWCPMFRDSVAVFYPQGQNVIPYGYFDPR